jgi:hypothetical protein
MNLNPFSGGGLPGIPDLGSILGGSGGGGLLGLPGLPNLFGMGGGAQQQGPDSSLGGTIQMRPYSDTSTDSSGGVGGTMNLQALLDMMQRNQYGGGGTQSYIGGQGLI